MAERVQEKLVDELGQLCEEVRPMNSRIEFLKRNVFKPLGSGIYTGKDYEIVVTPDKQKRLDQDKVRGLLTLEQFESCFTDTPIVYVEPRKRAIHQLGVLLQAAKAATKAKVSRAKQKGKKRAA